MLFFLRSLIIAPTGTEVKANPGLRCFYFVFKFVSKFVTNFIRPLTRSILLLRFVVQSIAFGRRCKVRKNISSSVSGIATLATL